MEDKTDKSFLIIVLIYKVNIVVCLLVVIFILFLLLICRHKKRELTAIGSFRLPHLSYPIYAEKPTYKRERFAIFSEYENSNVVD